MDLVVRLLRFVSKVKNEVLLSTFKQSWTISH